MLTKHNIPPFFNADSQILILGSFPSVKSRETQFFYGHPKNRFWKVLAVIFGCELPITVEDKKALLLNNHIALWDVIAECEVTGSADSSISHPTPNDLSIITDNAKINKIFVNGKTAEKYYNKYLKDKYNEAICLPSTSPANAVWTLQKLIEKWNVIKD